MCDWLSCNSDGKGKIFYFNAEQRRVIYDGGQLKCQGHATPIRTRDELDSHSSIAAYFCLVIDKVNKYEFRPLDRKFFIDQLNTTDDSSRVKRKLKRLDYRKLAPPELIFKPLFYPFGDANRKRVTATDIDLLHKWASVWDSVGDSVGASVWASVRDSVGASVRASVRASVWDSVGDSVWDSVENSVGDSVWDSLGASVGASVGATVGDSVGASVGAFVGAYISSFFHCSIWKHIKHKKGENPFQPGIDLWMQGLVPSFDGKVWRLHGGKKGEVLKVFENGL